MSDDAATPASGINTPEPMSDARGRADAPQPRAATRQIRLGMSPATALSIALAGLALLGIGASLEWYPMVIWYALALVLAVATAADFFAGRALRLPRIKREMPSSLSLGVRATVTLEIENRGRFQPRALIHDIHPIDFAAPRLPLQIRITHGTSRYDYDVRPQARGDAHFGQVHCVLRSPLGLWWNKTLCGEPALIRVYPNFSAVSRYALLAMEDRLSEIGVRKRRRRGEGSEFQQLREYRDGDSLRQIDWRATARVRKLISREYQDERDQSVIFLLDCGRRMRAQDDALSHFDQALNAVLLLAYVALRKGDAVGIGTFGGQERWFPPVKGHASINRMLNQLYDLQPGLTTPDYARAAVDLLNKHNKHAMVIVVTNLRDEDAEDMRAAVHALTKRHLVLLASTREQAIDQAISVPVRGFTDSVRVGAAHSYIESRKKYMDALRAQGVGCLDVLPGELSVELVNMYLALKARGAF
jgi:uncharacterized protein (DUF58 family)